MPERHFAPGHFLSVVYAPSAKHPCGWPPKFVPQPTDAVIGKATVTSETSYFGKVTIGLPGEVRMRQIWEAHAARRAKG